MSGNEIFKPKNVAAWQLKKKERPFVVDSAPYTSPPEDHVTVQVVDVAVNPIDWVEQDSELFELEYPNIFGLDVAGEVVEVGKGVDEFRVGQRVIAHCNGYNAKDPSQGAFQKYTVIPKSRIAELPYAIPTSTGVVLPLGISTAAAGLYQEGFLALPLPVIEDKDPLERTLLVWGGSSSVGSCCIQLAVASGAEVITTASPDNFEYCKKLGAVQCFDYHDGDVEDQIVKALEGRTVLGAYDAIGMDGVPQACARIVDRTKGKAIMVTVRGVPDEGIPDSVRAKAIGSSAIFDNDVGPYIWRDFLPKALDNGKIVPNPEPMIVGEELRSVQAGLDRQKKGVSAKKVVVTHIS